MAEADAPLTTFVDDDGWRWRWTPPTPRHVIDDLYSLDVHVSTSAYRNEAAAAAAGNLWLHKRRQAVH
jgi:hypothetical protein